MEDVDVPPFFLCPISLQIMKDPVVVSSGVTYDRQSIEKWLFSIGNSICPVTKQVLSDSDLTPNHTLRRLIQAWCTVNAGNGVERIPTPNPPVTKTQIANLLEDAKTSPLSLRKCLRQLRSIASESRSNQHCMEAAGVVEFCAGVVVDSDDTEANSYYVFDFMNSSGEALSVLCSMKISNPGLKNLLENNTIFVISVTRILQTESYSSRAYAVTLLKSMFQASTHDHVINVSSELLIETVQVLKDQISQKATKAALKLLIRLCRRCSRNTTMAVRAGAVRVLIELLLDLDSSEKRACEMILTALDLLCCSREGGVELVSHAAAVAVVSEKIIGVSAVASEMAVAILRSIARSSAGVDEEMVEMGIVTKLCVLIQEAGRGSRTRNICREIVKVHCEAWRNSPCFTMNLRVSYPS